MSRDKFEAWAVNKLFDIRLSGEEGYLFEDVRAAYEGWLAGRESMRDEAAAICDKVELNAQTSWKLNYYPDDQGRSNGACECAFDIRKIEL